MPAAAIQFYDDIDTSIVTAITFSDIVPGTPTAASEVHVWNDKGGTLSADEAKDVQLFILGRLSAGGDDYLSSGLELLDQRSVEVRVIGYQGIVGNLTGWRPLGTSSFLELENIPSDTAIEVEIRINAPASSTESAIDIAVRIETSPTYPLGLGHYLGNGNGIHQGIGDKSITSLMACSDVVEDAAPDADTDIQEMSWIHEGIPYNELSDLYTWTNLDGSAVALSSGEEYWGLISVGSSVTITKSDLGSSPLADSARPAVPSGEIAIAYVRVQFDLVINDADIYNVWQLEFFGQTNAGLTATLGPGRALVDNNFIRHSSDYDITLDPSSTTEVFLLPGGLLSSTVDGTRPDPRALALWEFVTDGSVVTAYTDLRKYLTDFLVTLDIYANPLTTSHYAVWTNGYNVPAYIRPGEVIAATVHDAGTGLSTGSYVFEIETLSSGTWTTIFTSSGTDDRRPTIDYTLFTDFTSLPEVLVVLPGESIRAIVDAVPTGTTPAAGATITIPMEVYS